MYEHASVVAIKNNNIITVSCETDTCANCKAGTFCATKGKTFNAHNGTDRNLSIGDTVEIYLPPGKTVTAGFIALLVPILLFPVGYYLPSLFNAEVGEGVRIIGGIAGIGLGFFISRLFSKAKSGEYTPEVTRIIEEN
ncbi:SoxR reducing system RseC family protein [Pleomorphochaeta sp. DL1XJH-081]|uniref:SoxR reducing system RseC family protein n=1 Tax=Pleomorphochaeta sp. DL1XJH-081 TaxID=3409690 RepID=UPI003BB60C59